MKNLQNSLKHGTDLNADATSANTRVNHITILELHTLLLECVQWKYPLKYKISTNKTSNVTKQSYFDVFIIDLWCVSNHLLGFFLFFFYLFFWSRILLVQ